MAYTPDYSEADLSSSVIDTIVKVILVASQLITIIVIIALFVWMKKKVR